MIVVLSQGCAANFGDGEKIARILSQKSEVTFEFPEAKPAHSTKAENSTSTGMNGFSRARDSGMALRFAKWALAHAHRQAKATSRF